MSRSQSERVGHYNTVVYSQAMTLVVLLILYPFLGSGSAVAAAPAVVLVAAGLVNFAAFIFLYRAFHKGVVSVVAPIAYTYPAVTTVFSVLILGTVLPSTRALAIAGVILGVILLSSRFSELRNYLKGVGPPNITAGVGSAIGSALLFGLVYVGIGYATPAVGFVLPAVVLRGVAAGAGFLIAPLAHQKVRPSRLAVSNTIIVMAVLESIGFLSFTYGVFIAGDALPVMAAISGMGGAVATGYAMIFLKERLEANQVLGVVLSFTGVFALLYLSG